MFCEDTRAPDLFGCIVIQAEKMNVFTLARVWYELKNCSAKVARCYLPGRVVSIKEERTSESSTQNEKATCALNILNELLAFTRKLLS